MISSTYFTFTPAQKLFRVFIGFIFILLFISLGRTLWISYQTQIAIQEQADRVLLLENEVQALEKELQDATSSFSLEQRVRDDLKMQKPGEKIYKIN